MVWPVSNVAVLSDGALTATALCALPKESELAAPLLRPIDLGMTDGPPNRTTNRDAREATCSGDELQTAVRSAWIRIGMLQDVKFTFATYVKLMFAEA